PESIAEWPGTRKAVLHGDGGTMVFEAGNDVAERWTDGVGWHRATLFKNAESQSVSATMVAGIPHVLFSAYQPDATVPLEHAWWQAGAWQCEELDGVRSASSRVGEGGTQIEGDYVASIEQGGLLNVYYSDWDGLRHAWLDDLGWHYELVDPSPITHLAAT